jgi:hypothetical protein
MTHTLTVQWFDHHREPQCAPDPAYPNGIDIDCADGAAAVCSVALAYPAPRCGVYLVKCGTCRQSVLVTAAGRPDDPRSLTLACRRR